jgi:hypothetical protein
VSATRLRRRFGLGSGAADVATAFSLHPAFGPAAYVDWRVSVDDDVVHLELGPCPALDERGLETWMGLLAAGHERALTAIATEINPHWRVRADGDRRWTVERSDEPADELAEVTVTKFSTGVAFGFDQ